MSEGENRRVESQDMKLDVDELSTLYSGDTAVAFGDMKDHFKLMRGMEFDLQSRWTATLIKQAEGWKLAALHVSTNMFENGVSALLIKWAAIKTGIATLFVGLLCGLLAATMWNRRKA
jgi:hypothetical protein